MKRLLIVFIEIYQKFLSSILKQIVGTPSSCRFYPTCSDYAKHSIREKGIILGTQMSILRILKCQPFYRVA